MKKRLLIYFNSLNPPGGIERVIATLSNKLSYNYDVTILVKDEPVSFYELNSNVKIFSLENGLKFNMNSRLSRIISAFSSVVKNYTHLRDFLKDNEYDYYYLAHPLNVLEFALARGIDKKVVITEHGSQTAYNSVYKFLKRSLYFRCRTYVVPTTADTTLYESLGFPAEYIPHFRSDLPYSQSPRDRNILLNIGRFTEVKQQMLLLGIWKNIVQEHGIKNWRLQLVGNGELEGQFKDFIAENSLTEHVELLPPMTNVEEYYLNASIFALTSSSEGFGMVLLEAISFGLPCVSFNCPSGPRDMIVDGKNGYLIPLNDSVKFENSLLKLIRDRNLMNTMGDNALLTSTEWRDENVLQKWYKILN